MQFLYFYSRKTEIKDRISSTPRTFSGGRVLTINFYLLNQLVFSSNGGQDSYPCLSLSLTTKEK